VNSYAVHRGTTPDVLKLCMPMHIQTYKLTAVSILSTSCMLLQRRRIRLTRNVQMQHNECQFQQQVRDE
jgi:hypothetical protein